MDVKLVYRLSCNIGKHLDNIITGHYIDSTGVLVKNEHWTIVLPIVVILAITRIRRDMFQKKLLNLYFIYSISILYLTYLTIATYGVSKFLMPVYPFLIILSLSHACLIYSIIVAWMRSVSPKSKVK